MSKRSPNIHQALNLFNKNRLTNARRQLLEIIAHKQKYPEAWQLLGMTEARLGQFSRAEDCFRTLIDISPGSADGHYYLGSALEAQHRYSEAAAEYSYTIQLQPTYIKAYYNLGNISNAEGRLNDAVDWYQRALNVKPDYIEALNNLGSTLKKLSRFDEALDCFHKALHILPESAEILTNIGNIFQLMEDYVEARRYYRKALERNPGIFEAYSGISSIYFRENRKDEAVDILHTAMEIFPDDPRITANLATVHEQAGDFDKASALLTPALKHHPDSFELAIAYGELSPHTGSTGEAILAIESTLDRKHTTAEKMQLLFLLGRLYERRRLYDKAFDCITRANQLKLIDFDPVEYISKINKYIAHFSNAFMSKAPRSANTTRQPVFIIGTPRSGTSLVEQILASHPDVYGAGELMDIGMIAAHLHTDLQSTEKYPACVQELTVDIVNSISERYTRKLSSLDISSKRITDKMPANYLHLGLIELMLPGARVIHCVRDALDTCLSCYFTDFLGYHPYAYTQRDLGIYYCQYLRLMAHWEKVISLPFYTVNYETMVRDPEGVTRDLLKHCGLDWDDRCLRFYESNRAVHTASYDQVRRPIYTSSIGRSRHYYDKLQPLLQELGKCGANG